MSTKEHYLAVLERSFKCEQEDRISDSILTRLIFLSESVFDFTLYDSYMDALFAKKAVEVCNAITERKTFEYIDLYSKEIPVNYKWYLIMTNMPFFANKLNWGTSIRGAYWNYGHQKKSIAFESTGIHDEEGKKILRQEFTIDQWTEFMKAVVEFAAPEMTDTFDDTLS